jgi:hypothetical protein
MRPNEDLRHTKESVEDQFLELPGVVGVDIGFKERNGRRTEVLAIRVLVERKKPLADVPEQERVPETIEDYYTDVIERGTIRFIQDTGRYDPLVGGISIGTCGGVGGAGTLGAIVRDVATGQLGLLSNWHVLVGGATGTPGLQVAQPAAFDGGSCLNDIVGTVTRSALTEEVDAAVALLNFARPAINAIQEMPPLNTVPTMAAQLGWPVTKRGRTTGRTYGTVDSVDATISFQQAGVWRTWKKQIGIWRNKSQNWSFALDGDSGSVVLDSTNRRIVGLLFANSDPPFQANGAYAYANPIASVLFALNVRIFNPKTKEKEKEKDFEKDLEKEDDKLGAGKERMIEGIQPLEYPLGRQPSDIVGPSVGAGGLQDPGPLHERLSRLEASMEELQHFILKRDRPDEGATSQPATDDD